MRTLRQIQWLDAEANFTNFHEVMDNFPNFQKFSQRTNYAHYFSYD